MFWSDVLIGYLSPSGPVRVVGLKNSTRLKKMLWNYPVCLQLIGFWRLYISLTRQKRNGSNRLNDHTYNLIWLQQKFFTSIVDFSHLSTAKGELIFFITPAVGSKERTVLKINLRPASFRTENKCGTHLLTLLMPRWKSRFFATRLWPNVLGYVYNLCLLFWNVFTCFNIHRFWPRQTNRSDWWHWGSWWIWPGCGHSSDCVRSQVPHGSGETVYEHYLCINHNPAQYYIQNDPLVRTNLGVSELDSF